MEAVNVSNNELTQEYKAAVETHKRIMANGEICAFSLLEICKDLKKMRDEKLYEEFGYSSFGEYVEKAVGIKPRQAYTYIQTYERLGSTVLQSNASLGITKLNLLAQINPQERSQVIENGEYGKMSVAEIKALVKKCNDQGEQISLLNQQISDVQAAEKEKLQNKIEELKAQIEKLKNAAQKEKTPKSENEAVNKKIENAKKEAAEAAEEKIKILEKQIEEKEKRARQLQTELELSDEVSARAKVYIYAIQDDFNKLFENIESMPDQQGNKFRQAALRLLEVLKNKCEE